MNSQVDDSRRLKKIFLGISSLSFQSFINSLLGFALLSTLLRLLPASSYGIYSAVQLSVGLAGTVSSWGFSSSVVKFLPRDERGKYVNSSITLTVIFSLVSTLIFLIISPFLSLYFAKSLSFSFIFQVGALWLFTSTVSSTIQAVLQGERKYITLASVLLVAKIISVSTSVVLIYLTRDVIVAIIGWIIYGLLVSLGGLLFSDKRIKLSISKDSMKEIISYSTPLAISSIIVFIASTSDIVIVGGYLDPVSLGVYNAAVTILSILSLLIAAPLNTAFFAELSFSNDSEEKVKTGFDLALRFILITVLPASFFLASVSFQLTELFSGGGVYLYGLTTLEITSLLYIFNAIALTCNSLFQGIGKTWYVFLVSSAIVLSDVTLSLILVPRIGLLGAGIGRAFSGMLGGVLGIHYAKKFAYLPNRNFVIKVFLSSIFPSSAVLAMSVFVSNELVTIFLYSVVELVAFILFLKLFGVLNERDIAILEEALPRFFRPVLKFLKV
jgi:stage V sporulation protein B